MNFRFLILLFMLVFTACKKGINPEEVASIELIQRYNPHHLETGIHTQLPKSKFILFLNDFENRKQTWGWKSIHWSVINIRLKNGKLKSYKISGKALVVLLDEDTGFREYSLEDANLVTKYWEIPKDSIFILNL